MEIVGHPYKLNIVVNGSVIQEMDNGQVPMAHGDNYAIRVHSNKRCRANILIDGVSVGKFILEPGRSYDIERPVDNQMLFTFFAVDTEEAKASLHDSVSREKRGLVEVIFAPQKAGGQHVNCGYSYKELLRSSGSSGQSVPDWNESSVSGSFGGIGYSAGVTGLTGHSNQKFSRGHLDVDEDKSVTLRLRLVIDNEKAKTVKVTPLSGRLPMETDIPPTAD